MSQFRPEVADADPHLYARGTLSTAGLPVDAGTVQLHFESDMGVLTAESYRHLVLDILGNFGPHKGSNERGYTDLADVTDPGGHGYLIGDVNEISWKEPDFARRYGPFGLILDESGHGGVPAVRAMRVQVYCKRGAGSSLRILAQLNASPSPDAAGAVAFAAAYAPSSDGFVTLDLTPGPLAAADPATVARTVRQSGSASLAVLEVSREAYLFVGWYSTHDDDRVYSVSAYEVPA